jgi:hypothetical protein
MYPRHFGTVDQFAVKPVRKVKDLPEAPELDEMNPRSLESRDGAVLRSSPFRPYPHVRQRYAAFLQMFST